MFREIDNKYLPKTNDNPVEFIRIIGPVIYIRAKEALDPAVNYKDPQQEANARAIAGKLAGMKKDHRIFLESGAMGVSIRAGTAKLETIRKEVFDLFNIDKDRPVPVLPDDPEPVISEPARR